MTDDIRAGTKLCLAVRYVMFIGRYPAKVDRHGRVPIPPSFLDSLQKLNGSDRTLVIGPHHELNTFGLAVYPLNIWKELDAYKPRPLPKRNLREAYFELFR